jgi:hypothetical protein
MTRVAHGLPKLISDKDVDNDLPVDCDFKDMSLTQLPLPLPGETTVLGAFLAYVRILAACLNRLYTATRRRDGDEKIPRLEMELHV